MGGEGTQKLIDSLTHNTTVKKLVPPEKYESPVSRVNKKRDWSLQSFNDLPQGVYQQLCELGRIAYKGIRNDQQVIFHQRDLETMSLSLRNFDTLGLMQRVQELYADEGAAVSYNFLHLTIQ